MSESNYTPEERRFEPHTCVLRLVRDKIPNEGATKPKASSARFDAAKDIAGAASAARKRGGLAKLHARLASGARGAAGRSAVAPTPHASRPVRSMRHEFRGPERYLIQFTTHRVLYEKLALASVLLGEHKGPASLEEVVTIALEALFDGVV